MKSSVFITLFFAMFLLSSCGGDKPARPDALLTEAQKQAADASADAASAAGIQSAPAGDADLPHYYCPNKCAGSGGGSQGTCPTCGTAYAHNQAFHNKTAAPPTNTNTPTIVNGDGTPFSTTPLTPTAVTPPKAPEPAQNADGVWHWTCSAGCAGGGGGAGSCGTCGGALAHNQAYHN